MKYLWLSLLVLSPALLLIIPAYFITIHRSRCHRCHRRSLRYVNSVLVHCGSFYECESCSARLARKIGGRFEDVSDEEWHRYVLSLEPDPYYPPIFIDLREESRAILSHLQTCFRRTVEQNPSHRITAIGTEFDFQTEGRLVFRFTLEAEGSASRDETITITRPFWRDWYSRYSRGQAVLILNDGTSRQPSIADAPNELAFIFGEIIQEAALTVRNEQQLPTASDGSNCLLSVKESFDRYRWSCDFKGALGK